MLEVLDRLLPAANVSTLLEILDIVMYRRQRWELDPKVSTLLEILASARQRDGAPALECFNPS